MTENMKEIDLVEKLENLMEIMMAALTVMMMAIKTEMCMAGWMAHWSEI